jgi:hypothetical protein
MTRFSRTLAALCLAAAPAAAQQAFRPPAVPLVAHNPYFSIWSHADKLTDVPTRHWTQRPHRLTSMVRIDGRTYRVMGDEPKSVPALPQTGVTVLPTRTIASFRGGGIALSLTFLTPALPEDLSVLSRPLTYVTWAARSIDGQPHSVQVYFDANPEIAVNDPDQVVTWSAMRFGNVSAQRTGTVAQRILGRTGDSVRIDWGYLYVGVEDSQKPVRLIADGDSAREAFSARKSMPAAASDRQGPAASAPALITLFDMGSVRPTAVSRRLMLAYDEIRAIRFSSQDLLPYWRRNGWQAPDLLKNAAKQFATLAVRCEAFDSKLMADLTKAGGPKYAALCAAAYRQTLAGNGLAADAKKQPLLFPKENTSNGCIATVDIIYPMAPMFLLLSPSLSKAMLEPVLAYSASPRWKFPFAPHDIGTYPHATAQVYGGGERTEENQMPVEESANMIIVTAALAQIEGNADYAKRYWSVLSKWAAYLREKGYDPENQLCTDDFTGHLARNVNLSAKAIVALGAYGRLCEMAGRPAEAREYTALAKQFARRWQAEAMDGDHSVLAFGNPGTWSQKYNLVWDSILGLGLFPQSLKEREMAFYRRKLDNFGLPLDSRRHWAKADWTLWTATLTGKPADFQALLEGVYDYYNTTEDRQPLNDLYWTQTGKHAGMHARPVVGGFYLRMLYDKGVWTRWARRDTAKPAGWAPFPRPVPTTTVLPTSEDAPATWRWVTTAPPAGWQAPGFDDSAWSSGEAGFGEPGTPGAIVRTRWNTPEIWLRRTVDLPSLEGKRVFLRIHHDEDAEVYVNGVRIADLGGYTAEYSQVQLSAAAMKAFRVGANTIAVHCRQTIGGQYIDLGIEIAR